MVHCRFLWLSIGLACHTLCAADSDAFTVRVIDADSGRGVPLVQLETVNHIRYYTDSAGIVSFNEPGLMNQSVFFHINSHGYIYPKDGFGYRGAQLLVSPGGEVELKIQRVNIAQRLYRVTGEGIYRDSLLAGKPVPLKLPVLNAQVLGSDSVVNTIYRGKIYWFWGDTHRARYPLGNFHVPGAVSMLPNCGGLDPALGVDLEYFIDPSGFAKPTAKLPGTGPTWINGLVTLESAGAQERLFAAYVKVKPPLEIYERGLAEFHDETAQFEKLVEFDMKTPLVPGGHPFKHSDQGIEYVYFGDPFPIVRVPATPEHLRDASKYETYTCLKQGGRADACEIDRQGSSPRYSWKTDTIPFTPQLQSQLISAGQIRPEEGLYRLQDETGKPVVIHCGSVYWNEYRQRWIMIGVQSFGSSLLGEVWYAEAEQLMGPWEHGRKIVTHDRYSFYNPKQHPMFDQDGGRIIFFEGTYTSSFSGNPDHTPRYDYNQIMYQLDLSDPRLR